MTHDYNLGQSSSTGFSLVKRKWMLTEHIFATEKKTNGWAWPFLPNVSSVQFSRSFVFDSLWPHESQQTRPPCPSPTPRVHPNPCPLSQWCHPTISSCVIPFSSCPQSLPTSGSFPMSQLFASGSASALVNIQGWVPLGLTGLISLLSRGLSSSTNWRFCWTLY